MTSNRKPSLKYDEIHTDSKWWDEIDDRLKQQIGKRRPRAEKREKAARIADELCKEFPDATCALNFKTPFQLLVATILSAQCTDERVNKVTPGLFKKFKTPKDFAEAGEGEIEEAIRSTGFFNSKAKSIRGASETILDQFGGKLPRSMEDLLQLRGTARKTANVVRMHGYGLPGLSVDTHFSRITQRLGLTKEKDPEKIEFDLAALLPPDRWTHFANAVILHGRKTCSSRNPKCDLCGIADLCPSAGKVKTPPPKKKKRSSNGA